MPDSTCEQPRETRQSLIESLPEELEGVFSKKSRNSFFRKTYFLRISKKTAVEIGLKAKSERPVLCFLSDRDSSIHSYSKTLIL